MNTLPLGSFPLIKSTVSPLSPSSSILYKFPSLEYSTLSLFLLTESTNTYCISFTSSRILCSPPFPLSLILYLEAFFSVGVNAQPLSSFPPLQYYTPSLTFLSILNNGQPHLFLLSSPTLYFIPPLFSMAMIMNLIFGSLPLLFCVLLFKRQR